MFQFLYQKTGQNTFLPDRHGDLTKSSLTRTFCIPPIPTPATSTTFPTMSLSVPLLDSITFCISCIFPFLPPLLLFPWHACSPFHLFRHLFFCGPTSCGGSLLLLSSTASPFGFLPLLVCCLLRAASGWAYIRSSVYVSAHGSARASTCSSSCASVRVTACVLLAAMLSTS